MLVDRVLKEIPNIMLMGRKLSDAVVFRVHEGIEDYKNDKRYHLNNRTVAYNINPGEKGIKMPTFFPYNNMVVQFDDGFDWYVTIDKIESMGYDDDNIRMVANVFLRNESSEIDIFKRMLTFRNGDYRSTTAINTNMELITYPIFLLTKDGYVMDVGVWDNGDHLFIVHSDLPLDLKHKIQLFAQDSISSAKKFLEIISCKNIAPELVEPPKKLQKKRKKSGKLPFKSYYVLKVNPIGKRPPVDSKPGQGIWSNRVHYCRGHFKEYSSDRPLFGKYVGRYWFNPQVRGSKSQGVIEKDYEL